jgi:hypothetical protein
MSSFKLGFGLLVGLMMSVAACNNSDASGSGGGDSASTSTSTSTGSSGATFHCCLNASAYDCPNKAALDKCAGGDIGACIANCNPMDPMCFQKCQQMAGAPDPSACSQVNQPVDAWCKSSGSTSSGGSSGSSGGSCVGDWTGADCTYDAQCGSGNHCAEGRCYPGGQGNPCTYDAQCDSSNCTNGCCQPGGSSGSGSGSSSSGGTCGSFGDACFLDLDCCDNYCDPNTSHCG